MSWFGPFERFGRSVPFGRFGRFGRFAVVVFVMIPSIETGCDN
jgi:hypothetical protein